MPSVFEMLLMVHVWVHEWITLSMSRKSIRFWIYVFFFFYVQDTVKRSYIINGQSPENFFMFGFFFQNRPPGALFHTLKQFRTWSSIRRHVRIWNDSDIKATAKKKKIPKVTPIPQILPVWTLLRSMVHPCLVLVWLSLYRKSEPLQVYEITSLNFSEYFYLCYLGVSLSWVCEYLGEFDAICESLETVPLMCFDLVTFIET
jgi:hypothetical protein